MNEAYRPYLAWTVEDWKAIIFISFPNLVQNIIPMLFGCLKATSFSICDFLNKLIVY
jgi:hypothetical protein